MKDQFITLKDAVILINNQKSYSSLTRLFNKLKSDKITTKHTKTVNSKCYISKEFLLNHFSHFIKSDNQNELQKENLMQQNETIKDQSDKLKNDIIELLQSQIKEKDSQLSELLERNRESNILIQSLHSQLAIGSGKDANKDELNGWQHFKAMFIKLYS